MEYLKILLKAHREPRENKRRLWKRLGYKGVHATASFNTFYLTEAIVLYKNLTVKRHLKEVLTMNKEQFLGIFRNSIRAITEERYFSTERGYQGHLLAELKSRLNIKPIFLGNPIVEQEYQKTLKNHRITIRPDIIIHIPHERKIYKSRRKGNFIGIQIKQEASKEKAREDFSKIDLMFKKLDYLLGIFLNINSDTTFFDSYSGDYKDRLHCFAVRLVNNKVVIYESP